MEHYNKVPGLPDPTSTSQPSPAPPMLQTPQAQLLSVPGEVEYLSDKEQHEAELQVKWSSWMSEAEGRKNSSLYKHVCVLLLSWHPNSDDLKVGEEVSISN